MALIDLVAGLLQDPMGAIQGWVAQGPAVALGLIFLVVFIETGVVVMPFLPGDSLLFAAGVICHGQAGAALPFWELLLCVWAAAILGDQCNFMIGHFLGRRIIASGRIRSLTPERIQQSEAFMAKWGGLSIFLGRFFPFIRTFVPFLAGVGGMRWHHFFGFNVLGGIAWSTLFASLGYFFGQIQAVQDHFELVVVGIVAVSAVPAVVAAVRARLNARREADLAQEADRRGEGRDD